VTPRVGDLAHAERRRDPGRRAATLARRLALRALAARVLGVGASEVTVEQDSDGPPRIARPAPLHGALAARDGWTLVGVSPIPLGLDIEAVDGGRAPLDLLHPAMARRLADAGPPAFTEAWCAIEAYLKLLGVGLEGLAEVAVEDGRATWVGGARPPARVFARSEGHMAMAVALSPAPPGVR
jgi:phosphopantetheinyl transferase